MLLSLANVSKVFGTRSIFRQVNCTIRPAEITLLVGANGAGKSTLLRIMAGLAQPATGEVIYNVSPEAVSYVGHATFIYPALTAWENLAFWRDAQGLDGGDARIDHALARVELSAYAHDKAGVFSRGMAQRLNLARVLMGEPQLILLDEPGTGLDVHSLALLRREIQQAVQRGAGIVWISHDLQSDVPLAHRILALEKGRLVYDGAAADFTGLNSLQGTKMPNMSDTATTEALVTPTVAAAAAHTAAAAPTPEGRAPANVTAARTPAGVYNSGVKDSL